MAMFDLRDSSEIKLERCQTTSETLLSGENVKDVVATDCKAGASVISQSPPLPPVPISSLRKALNFAMGQLWALGLGILIAVVAAVVIFRFGLIQ
ncbi:hypothetical protein [Pseudomonas bubulae]|uniref:hypothetical protein n=1 Tax=Pseudomonas bubulae TaxID=2316085 RepID=UPI0010326333|nr:hypothetical protein [Pseudomonas bubulae]